MACLFCQIVDKKVPAEIIYEDSLVLGFNNIEPEAPLHFLFIPKQHMEWPEELTENKLKLLASLISAAKKVAVEKGIDQACKFIFNVGKTGHIPHIHLHLLGGWKEAIPMHNI